MKLEQILDLVQKLNDVDYEKLETPELKQLVECYDYLASKVQMEISVRKIKAGGLVK